jgi:hypothetical protein
LEENLENEGGKKNPVKKVKEETKSGSGVLKKRKRVVMDEDEDDGDAYVPAVVSKLG